jgi:hypothetical protein
MTESSLAPRNHEGEVVSDLNEQVEGEAPSGISRRTVTKAMAWAVPVIAVAAPVPAYAASQIMFDFNGEGCKLPGNSNTIFKGYAFALSINNNSTVPITITITSITLNGVSLGATGLVDLDSASFDPNPFTLDPGEDVLNAALVTQNAGNSSNGTLSITYTINSGTPTTVTATVDAAPPINGNSCQAFTDDQKDVLADLGGIAPAWGAGTQYVVGDQVTLSGGAVLAATNAGTSGTTEPVAPATIGGTVNDNGIIWERVA